MVTQTLNNKDGERSDVADCDALLPSWHPGEASRSSYSEWEGLMS